MREDGDRDPDVGSLAEETVKLLGVLKGWAQDHGAGADGPRADRSEEEVAAATDGTPRHRSDRPAECTVCPWCRTAEAFRELSPDVRAHLGAAAASVGQAFTAFLSTQPPRPAQYGAGRPDD